MLKKWKSYVDDSLQKIEHERASINTNGYFQETTEMNTICNNKITRIKDEISKIVEEEN